ncbi:MAG: methyltransferase domain-containing protein [Cytophagaceae bacterium]
MKLIGIYNKILRKWYELELDEYSGIFHDQNEEKIFLSEVKSAKDLLLPYYSEYVRSVSVDSMAISIELASVLFAFCKMRKPKKVLDLGSGFSSFTFRLYQKLFDNNCEVFSVDDDVQWLDKTRKYLVENSLSSENLLDFNIFMNDQETEEFELVLHDMNYVEIRINYLLDIIKKTKNGGFLILDDVHKNDYFLSLLKLARGRKDEFYSLKKITLDKYRRYSLLLLKR